jgi:hypothetical protein
MRFCNLSENMRKSTAFRVLNLLQFGLVFGQFCFESRQSLTNNFLREVGSVE